jgi:hypothetical protein
MAKATRSQMNKTNGQPFFIGITTKKEKAHFIFYPLNERQQDGGNAPHEDP